jgi:SAM-dependent methyltransferase
VKPAAWLTACRGELEAARACGPIVDLACGRGRNALALAGWGTAVVGIDRNAAHLAELRASAHQRRAPVACVRADLEASPGFPLKAGSCGAILVFRFLYRPLAAEIVRALAPGGLLVYETFTVDQRELGYGPKSAAFFLEPGELPKLFGALSIEATWEGLDETGERPEAVARLRARKPGG